MKRSGLVLVGLLLLVASLAQPAMAKKKKPKPPAPIPVTLYAHGEGDPGNIEQSPAGTGFMDMDTSEPSGATSKSFVFWGAGSSPNPDCAGNSLLPVFISPFKGRVVGDMKFTFSADSTPAEIEVRIFPDIAAQACNEAYVPPIRSALVDSGAGEVIISGPDFDVQGVLMVQINPNYATPQLTRFLYDSTTDPTNLSLTCLPAAGSTACV